VRYRIGVDAGGTKVAYGLFDEGDRLVDRSQHPTVIEADGPAFSDQMIEAIARLMEKNGLRPRDMLGIGVCMPSFILFDEGYVCMTSAMVNIRDFAMRDYLQSRLLMPVILDNDSNVAALAEHRFGAGRGSRHMVYMAVSTGIGSGLILNGELYRGIHGSAGEIGHMFVSDSTGYPCGCGVSGCVESIASGANMAKYAMDRIKEGAESRILDHAGTISRIDMLAVGKAFSEDDPLAIEVVERGAEYLGRMFQSLYQIFDINVFVYGGGVMKLGERFVSRIIAAYRRHSQMEYRYPAQFLPAELGDNAGMIGAALLVK